MESLDPDDIEAVGLEDDDSLPDDAPHTLMYITDEEEADPFANLSENQKTKLKIVSYTKKENELIVYGFIREITKTNSNPSEINDICCLYNFIDISDLFESDPSWWTMFTKARNECCAFNFLLSKEICVQFIANNHEESCTFHSMLGLVYSRMQCTDLAEIEFKKAIELDPKSTAYLWNYSTFLRTLSRYKHASELLAKAMEIQPTDISYKFEYAYCLKMVADSNDNDEYKQEYLEKFEEITFTLRLTGGSHYKKYQTDAKNYLYTAVSYKYLNNLESAENEYDAYLDSMNLDRLTEGMTSFARLLYLLEKYDQALILINHAFKKNRCNPWTFYYYGLIMKIKGKYNEAKESFEKALTFSSGFISCQREYELLLSQ